MTNDTGSIQPESEDDGLSAEQLQMLGIEEYETRPEPNWVGGVPRALDRFADYEGVLMREVVDRIQRLNDNRFQQIVDESNRPNSSLVFGGGDVYQPTHLRGHTWESVVYDDAAPLTMFTNANNYPPEPELNLEEPNYENLQEMRTILDSTSED